MPVLTTLKVRTFLISLVSTLTACSTPETQIAPKAKSSEAATGIWESPAADYPAICIAFLPGGKLQFKGGFLFFNPGRWALDSDNGTVRLTLGGASQFPFQRAHYPLARGPGALIELNPAQRSLVYRLGADAASFDFAGFVFYRTATCSVN